MAKSKLTRQDWIAAAEDALRSGGPFAVRVEPIARTLGVSKGSFYWHFKDLRTMVEALWSGWRDQAIARVAQSSDRDALPVKRLMEWVNGEDAREDDMFTSTEAALRSWALTEPVLARMVREVDNARINDLADSLRATGVSRPGHAAQMLHATKLGLSALGSGGTAERRALLELVSSEAG